MLNWLKRNKKMCFIVGGAVLVCAVLLCIFLIPKDGGEQNKDTPILTVETPQKLSIKDTDTFVLDVSISSFGDAIYPAASMRIRSRQEQRYPYRKCLIFVGFLRSR